MSRFAVDRLFMFVLRGFSASKLSRQSGHAINKISSLSGVAKSSERKKNAENKSARRGVAKFSFLRANPGRDWTRARIANIFYRPIAPQCGSFETVRSSYVEFHAHFVLFLPSLFYCGADEKTFLCYFLLSHVQLNLSSSCPKPMNSRNATINKTKSFLFTESATCPTA